ncbi:hypothetical protein [Pseudocitrobacter cyperus]|uniref:HTH luxR-type domain-containing protein n=1 Tax=Pseudocitrobacter cyperus TaxID=3112843 RepID=A0ABV0HQI5_9ENTR
MSKVSGIMLRRYYIDSDNAFLSLAIQSIFDELDQPLITGQESEERILVLSEKKRIQDILAGKERRLEEYDLIICSEPYYSLCRQYLGKATRKIISMDRGAQALKHDIQAFINHREEKLELNDVSQLMALTPDERITITNYVSQYGYRKIACDHASNVKTISRYKRAAMSKLGYRSNMELWLAINFLFYLGYISLFHPERKSRGLSCPQPAMLQGNLCCF